MRQSTKSAIAFALKAILAVALIVWLVRGGALDWTAVLTIVRSPVLLAADLAMFAVCSVILGVIRWRLLLRLADVTLPIGRATSLQLVAFFFNVVIPGNVGGDVVKSLYVARDQPPEKRPTILLIVLIERLVGLAGLVGVAAVAILLRAREVFASPIFRPMAITIAALTGACLVSAIGSIVVVQKYGARVEERVRGTTRIARLLAQLLSSARLVAARPGVLVSSIVVSMMVHGGAMALFTLFAQRLTAQSVSFAHVATVFPLGMLTVVLPISPAGFGVGHLAFDRLFAAVGLSGGATVFNVYLLGQLVPCLFGAVPYLFLRTKLPETDVVTSEREC